MADGTRLNKSKLVGMSYERVTLRTCLIFLLLTIDQFETMEKKSAVEDSMKMGLQDKPRNKNSPDWLINTSAIMFQKYLYNNFLGDPLKIWDKRQNESTNFNLTQAELRMIHQSGAIIAFPAHPKYTEPNLKMIGMWFKIDTIPKNERIISANLKLYRGPDVNNYGDCFITACYIMTAMSGLKCVDSVNTIAGQIGWITLSVTEAHNHWVKNPTDDKGLYIIVDSIDHPSKLTKPEDIGIIGFNGRAEHQPFVTGFFNESKILTNNKPQVLINHQTILKNMKIDAKKWDTSFDGKLLKNHHRENLRPLSKGACRVRPLYVSFEDLQWQDWIKNPKGYYANYCSGKCNYPLNENINVTNHAIIQAILHTLPGSKIRKPCCVPTKLSPISIIHYQDIHHQDESNVGLRKYENMVVESCGCR